MSAARPELTYVIGYDGDQRIGVYDANGTRLLSSVPSVVGEPFAYQSVGFDVTVVEADDDWFREVDGDFPERLDDVKLRP